MMSSSSLFVAGCTFAHNHASNGGEMIFWEYSALAVGVGKVTRGGSGAMISWGAGSGKGIPLAGEAGRRKYPSRYNVKRHWAATPRNLLRVKL